MLRPERLLTPPLAKGGRESGEKLALTGSKVPAGSLARASGFLALKGPNRKAPGNARGTGLGTLLIHFLLKCPEGAQQILFRPFRADSYNSPSIPRALPWAFLSGPFRAGKAHRCATNRAGWGIAKSRRQAQLFISPGWGGVCARARGSAVRHQPDAQSEGIWRPTPAPPREPVPGFGLHAAFACRGNLGRQNGGRTCVEVSGTAEMPLCLRRRSLLPTSRPWPTCGGGWVGSRWSGSGSTPRRAPPLRRMSSRPRNERAVSTRAGRRHPGGKSNGVRGVVPVRQAFPSGQFLPRSA